MTAVFLLVLTLAAFDLGMYAYAYISIQNAARAAALNNSGGLASSTDQEAACAIAVSETQGLPNVDPHSVGNCTSAPLVVATALCEGGTACLGSTASADGDAAAVVRVTYSMPPLFRITSAMPASVSRTAQMKVRNIR